MQSFGGEIMKLPFSKKEKRNSTKFNTILGNYSLAEKSINNSTKDGFSLAE